MLNWRKGKGNQGNNDKQRFRLFMKARMVSPFPRALKVSPMQKVKPFQTCISSAAFYMRN
jgi:hypothetical protein